VTPEEAQAQRLQASARGHRRRIERKEVRLALKHGELTLAGALAHPATHGMVIARLLLWLPGHGPKTMPLLLERARVSHTRVVGTLTPREREALLMHCD
jgi:hypothetical protein